MIACRARLPRGLSTAVLLPQIVLVCFQRVLSHLADELLFLRAVPLHLPLRSRDRLLARVAIEKVEGGCRLLYQSSLPGLVNLLKGRSLTS